MEMYSVLVWLLAATIVIIVFAFFIDKHLSVGGNKRIKEIINYKYPPMVIDKFKRTYPELTGGEVEMVFDALSEYFAACYIYLKSHRVDGCGVGMPSKIVDEAWHIFLLFSKEYEFFSKKFFGKMLHHTPDDDAFAVGCHVGSAIKETENTGSPYKKSVLNLYDICNEMRVSDFIHFRQLPLVFTLDAKFNVPNGFMYSSVDAHAMGAIAQNESVGQGNKSVNRNNDSSSGGAACSGGVSSSKACGGYSMNNCGDSSSSGSSSSSSNSGGSLCSSCGGGGD